MKTKEEDEEEINASECSSGCQSGWTTYLDQSDDDDESRSFPENKATSAKDEDEDYEEEDLSMVSDASSGPPHFLEEDRERYDKNSGGKKRRVEVEYSLPFLDDTASSPFFTFPKASGAAHKVTKEDLSCGFSATHFKGIPAFGRRLGCSQSSTPAKTRSVCRGEGEKKLR